MLYSTEHEISPSHPTCLDYMRQNSEDTIVVNLMDESRRFFPRSIAEDEESGRVHVIHMLGCKVLVMTYTGFILFSYPLNGEILSNQWPNSVFKPRALCISNNLIFISDLRNKLIFIFTLDGNLVSYFPCADKPTSNQIKRPRGIAVDKCNNIYVCINDELKVFNSTLPVRQSYGTLEIGRPKDVQLFNELILVLSWGNYTSVFFLSTEGIVLRECTISNKGLRRPWYFDVDHYGNMLMLFFKDSNCTLDLYSQDGTLVASQKVSKVDRPKGIKFLKDKTLIAISAYGENSLVIL